MTRSLALLPLLGFYLLNAAPADASPSAEVAWERGHYSAAAKSWQRAAAAGDRRAQWMLGWLHERGEHGIAKDAGQSLRWYRRAIEGDDPEAWYNRGLAAALGKAGKRRSLRTAQTWYRKAAESGDPRIQARLGQCYLGEGLPPCGLRVDLRQAHRWLESAARTGDHSALCGLAKIYENGRGVIRSSQRAREWQDRAAANGRACGSAPTMVTRARRPAASQAADPIVAEVQRTLAELGFRPGPADGLPGQRTRSAIFDFQTRMGLPADGLASSQLLAELRVADPTALRTRLPEVAAAPSPRTGATRIPLPDMSTVNFGNYHALVIGNDSYQHLPNLGTARRDADAVAQLLRDDYGFNVTLLKDVNRAKLLRTFKRLREELTADDNLLVYYAGHGWYDEEIERGYWLPVDADEEDRSNWISNGTLTDDLKAMDAKHVMVVADSCYSGTWTRALTLRKRTDDYLSRMARKRTRVVLASGNLEPVSDRGGRGHSVFARAFLDALRENRSVIDGTQLFSEIRRPVMLDSEQTPQYGDIRNAGHGGGDFLFVRKP